MKKIFLYTLLFLFIVNVSSFSKQIKVTPVIITVSGTKLNQWEEKLIKETQPYGILLLNYNIISEQQIKNLKADINLLLNKKILFFIDQEGGDVNRLSKIYPNRKYHSPKYFGDIAKKDFIKAEKLLILEAKKVAQDLENLGIDVNLSPVLDLLNNNNKNYSNREDIKKIKTLKLNKRSFSSDPELVSKLGQIYIRESSKYNVELCLKHLIGLGSTAVDSHLELPLITKSVEELRNSDLIPFKKNINKVKYALVGHAIYSNIDSKNISTFSNKLINFIRTDLNFKGLLISDDLINMKALDSYSEEERVLKSLNSGIDIALVMLQVNNEKSYNYWSSIFKKIPRNIVNNFNYKLKIQR